MRFCRSRTSLAIPNRGLDVVRFDSCSTTFIVKGSELPKAVFKGETVIRISKSDARNLYSNRQKIGSPPVPPTEQELAELRSHFICSMCKAELRRPGIRHTNGRVYGPVCIHRVPA